MSLPRHIFNHSIIWLVLPIVVVLAMYVSIGRYFFPLLENYRDDLVLWANDQLAINLKIDQLDGQWNDFDPYIRLDQIEVYAPQAEPGEGVKPAIEVRNFSLELDSFSSFRYQFPVIRQASIQGVTLRLTQGDDSSWSLNGWGLSSAAADENNQAADATRRGRQTIREDVAPIARLLQFLLRQQHLKMEHVWLDLTDRYGREYRAYSRRLEVYEVDGRQRLQGQLQLDPSSPQQVAFIMEVSGDPFDKESLTVDFYLQADSQSLSSWLEKVAHVLPFELPELSGGIELWGSWKEGRLQSLKGDLKDASLKLTLPDQPEVRVSDLNSTLFWQQDQGGWELIADQLAFSLQERTFSLEQVTAEASQNNWQVQVSNLELSKLSDTLLEWPGLPDMARDALVRLKPKGVLRNTTVTQSEDKEFLLQTQLDSVDVDAFYGAPVLRNVNGYVESSAEAGFIRFHSDEFFMGYPELYSGGWWFDNALGEVHWVIGDALRVYGIDLQLKQGDSDVAGEFDLHSRPGEDDYFYLNVGLTAAEEAFGLQLVPDRVVAESLNDWLNSSIKQAYVSQGGFVFDGTLNLGAQSPPREIASLLLLDVKDSTLKFLPDWPQAEAVDAQVRLDGMDLDVALNSGRYLSNEGIKGEVTLRDDGIGNVVGLNLSGSVFPEWGWQIFTETPLEDLVPESLHDWQLSGKPLLVETDLRFPVDGRKGKGQVSVLTDANQLLIPELSSPLKHIQAEVIYDTEKGLLVDKGQAEFLGGEADFAVRTDITRGAVIVSGSGVAETTDINRWQPMPFSSWVTGQLNYEFSVDLDRISRLHLRSDLDGVSVSLPYPVGKAADTKKPLMVEMSFAPSANRFSVAYDSRQSEGFLLSHGIWGGDAKDYGVGVWYSNATVNAKALPEPTGRTDLYIDESVFDLEPWVAFAEQEYARQALTASVSSSATTSGQASTANKASDSSSIRLHVATDALVYKEFQLDDLTIDAESSGGGGQLSVVSQQLEGVVSLSSELLSFDMKRIFLKAAPSEARATAPLGKKERNEIFEQIFTPAWPDFDVSVDDFSIRGIRGQKLDASYRSSESSRQVNLKNLSQGTVDFSGTLDWLVDDVDDNVKAQTSVILNIGGQNLADVQKAFDIPVAVTSSRSDSSIRVNWQGMPHDVRSETLSGQVNIDLEKGSFEQVQSVPALKLLSLLNFESLVRRLQLDFSDLSGKGLSYDKVTGRVELKDGVGHIKEPIRVSGTSTKFEMTGELDFVDEKFDQEMVVTLPVGETLPFAAILAGAPQVGGTIYIIQKVFGNLFDKFTQATYTIQGDWDKPQIELKRVF